MPSFPARTLQSALPMWLFSLAILAALLALRILWPEFGLGIDLGASRKARLGLSRASSAFRELEEMLSAGLLPEAERWERLRELDAPWGRLAHESLCELRARGGSLLPTLKRLRE